MQSFFTQENSPSSIFKVFSGFSLILTLSWFVSQRDCYLPLNFPDVKEIRCCWILEEISEGKKTKTRDNTRVISMVKIIELRKDEFNKYQTIIMWYLFTFHCSKTNIWYFRKFFTQQQAHQDFYRFRKHSKICKNSNLLEWNNLESLDIVQNVCWNGNSQFIRRGDLFTGLE